MLELALQALHISNALPFFCSYPAVFPIFTTGYSTGLSETVHESFRAELSKDMWRGGARERGSSDVTEVPR